MAPTTRSQTSSLPSTPTPPPSKRTLSTSTLTTPSKRSKHQTTDSHPRQRLTPLSQSHQITLLSPHRTMALTPLLASAACGIFDFRIAEEPVRRLSTAGRVTKYQVHVSSIDLKWQVVKCRAAVGDGVNSDGEQGDGHGEEAEFELGYEKLVLAPGSETNTFSTPGVLEHCLTMKSVQDAMSLRERILDCFELASLPVCSEERQRELLHFVIVGGGPTGVELAAELDELVHGHLSRIYPDLEGRATISVYDVADRMLGQFGEKLSEYAMEKFRRRDVRVCMGREIEGFEIGIMSVKDEGEVKFGVAIWCAGNKATSLVEGLDVRKGEGAMQRVCTDRLLRVLKPEGKEARKGIEDYFDNIYALGDAADIEGMSLPPTAENENGNVEGEGFKYDQKALVAYIGRKDGIVDGGGKWTGKGAWLAWRSGSLEWTRSWRRRAMIVLVWVMNKLDGREIARR
ncbi:FAD/NAD(P)-binding domain containing protein [Hyaloscypha variabilis]